MRLIDADNVKFKFPYGFDNNGILMVPYNSCKCSLDDSPTVDAVPVVRCRDCITFEEIGKRPTNNGGTPFGYCYHWQYEQGMSPNEVDGNDFCSYGERRKSNENHT